MMTKFSGLRLLSAMAALLLSLSFVPATSAADDVGQLFTTIPVPTGVQEEAVKEVLIRALAGRQWTLQSKEGDRVVGYLKHRRNEAQVTFIYTASQIQVFCKGWQIDKRTGAREKPEQPTGWLKFLQKDITRMLTEKAALG